MDDYTLNDKKIPDILKELALEKGNPAFTASLHPGIMHVLGCRIPDLRKLAKQIIRNDWKAYLETAGHYYMEERLLHGLVLSGIQPDKDFQIYLQRVDLFVEQINSWSVCDAFKMAGSGNYLKLHAEELWNYLSTKAMSDNEYVCRFGVVMSMRYFIDRHHIQALFNLYSHIRNEGYYAKMSIAWALCECVIRFPEETTAFLNDNCLSSEVCHMTVQKIRESLRVDLSVKECIKRIKRTT